ncbi:hypothetical protein PoHVEF18_009997 [Penicillium ochrochloron]
MSPGPSTLNYGGSSRGTACDECRVFKKRCTRKHSSCSRCITKGKECKFTDDSNIKVEDAIPTTDIKSEASDTSIAASAVPVNSGLSSIQQIAPRQNSTVENTSAESTLHFESVSLIPMLNAEEIRGRWLKPNLMTGAEDVPDEDFMATSQYLSAILQSYPSQKFDAGIFPPFIHPMQLSRKPISKTLANCSSLVGLWKNHTAGSEQMVIDTVKTEIARLMAEKQSISDFDLLCSFQALLIYMLLAYFYPINDTHTLPEKDIATLHEIAFYSAKRGLTCPDETTRNRPDWESWVVSSAKRRTLLTTYLFTSIYNSLPCV